jgi:hypothetical protein
MLDTMDYDFAPVLRSRYTLHKYKEYNWESLSADVAAYTVICSWCCGIALALVCGVLSHLDSGAAKGRCTRLVRTFAFSASGTAN